MFSASRGLLFTSTLLFLVLFVDAQFFTKTSKSIPRMGRRSDANFMFKKFGDSESPAMTFGEQKLSDANSAERLLESAESESALLALIKDKTSEGDLSREKEEFKKFLAVWAKGQPQMD